MSSNVLIPILGLSFAVLFTVLALLEREGVSIQFVAEVTAITVLAATGGSFVGSQPHPLLFLAFTYLITMRARLLVDLARLQFRRGRARDALAILQVAERLLPDRPTRLLIEMNQGITHLRLQNPQTSQTLLEAVLEKSSEGGLGIRNRTACLYFLGHALDMQGKASLAKRYFRQASELFPSSPYAKAAAKVLDEPQANRSKKPRAKRGR